MIVARLIAPLSKLATAKALDPITAASSPGGVLDLGPVDEDELYTALDWLLERQPQIEATLARRHLKDGTLVLYDVSSSYFEGRCCPLAQFGFNSDVKLQALDLAGQSTSQSKRLLKPFNIAIIIRAARAVAIKDASSHS
jgi:hypothetical protein